MTTGTPMNRATRVQGVKGIAFVAAGLVLLGAQAGWWELHALLRWWPVALMAMGVARGAWTRDGFLWIGWGALCLIWSMGVWTWRESWPLLLVLYGVALVLWPSCSASVRRDGSRVG